MTFELSGGGSASLVTTDGRDIVVRSSRAFPPGATLEAAGDIGPIRVKVRSCRTEAGEPSAEPFRVEGRLVNLSRSQRERLLEA